MPRESPLLFPPRSGARNVRRFLGFLKDLFTLTPNGLAVSRDGRVVAADRLISGNADLMLIENFN